MNQTVSTPGSAQTVTVLRGLFQLASIIAITVWSLFEWALPWPGLLAAGGLLLLGVLLWALFLSPRPVLRTDRFGQGLVELLLLAGGVGALFGLGVWPVLTIAFGVIGAVFGYLGTRRPR